MTLKLDPINIEASAQPTPSAYTRGWNDALEAVAKWLDDRSGKNRVAGERWDSGWPIGTPHRDKFDPPLRGSFWDKANEDAEIAAHVRSLKKP